MVRAMREKELRLALVCYGGISLAVYMHGVTKEIWYATRASRAFHDESPPATGPEAVYRRLLETLVQIRELKLRILPDIISGASAGGINGVFLAQALASGQSLEPLSRLWLERADVEVLLDPDARPWSRFAKFWAQPLVWFLLKRPGNVVSRTVASASTRREVRLKLSHLIRARWFAPPFSGIGFSHLLAEALDAMGETGGKTAPLLPAGHPLDLLVTVTDFNGHLEDLRLNSPPVVEESEHRLAIGFRRNAAAGTGEDMAERAELVFAARSTASVPGAFPPLMLAEMDRLTSERRLAWRGREAFLKRVMPSRWKRGQLAEAALVDGAVLVNRPFAPAMAVLRDRPAQREVDRRFVYIDPSPGIGVPAQSDRPVGFFSAIFGSLSSIPREQPIRDNLEALEAQSRERARLRMIVDTLRGEIDTAVERLFGFTFFFDHPNQKRLTAWRAKAQQAAAEQAGFAFHGYAQVKLAGVVTSLAEVIEGAMADAPPRGAVEAELWAHLATRGFDRLAQARGGATAEAIAFFRAHDFGFRIRRLKLLARRLTQDWDDAEGITPAEREAARNIVYRAQALYQAKQTGAGLGEDFAQAAADALSHPGVILAEIARRRDLTGIDLAVDAMIIDGLAAMSKPLRRRFLYAYLGFPFYDVATLPLLQGEGMGEFDPVKVDRISPEDAMSIRHGGTRACLKGIEFFHFGAFFARAYRENDYLWGRLHGAERTVDLIASTAEPPLPDSVIRTFKRDVFLAILEEEKPRLTAEPGMVDGVIAEVNTMFAGG